MKKKSSIFYIYKLSVNTNIGDKMRISDLMIEAVDMNGKGIISNVEKRKNIAITTLEVNDSNIGEIGKYITIEFDDILNKSIRKEVVSKLKMLLDENNINEESSILVVGLGNERSTPDSLGPLVIENIIVTRHLEVLGLNSNRVVSAIKPGVMGETGIETKDIIKGVIEKIKPDCLIVIDALKSGSLKRLNKTIQLTDTGIHPGSGVQNKREKLDKKSLGIPVIAIGVPTVCDIRTIISENVDDVDDKNIPDMIITSKEIDFVIDKMSDLISICINKTLYDF